MMTRGRGGVAIPPKNDDVIYEQPLTSLWVASAITVSKNRDRLKKPHWVPPETLMVASYIDNEDFGFNTT